MIELYNTPTSTCSQKVRVCLTEKELTWENRLLNNRKKEQVSPDYLKLNPNGVVPTLVHDGHVITDSSVICEYIDEVFPEPRLSPEDPAHRARMRAWMRFLEEVPTASIRVPSFHYMAVDRYSHMSREEFLRNEADVRPLRRQFYHKMGPEGFSQDEVALAVERLDYSLARMERALTESTWLTGEMFTLADIIALPAVDRMRDLGMASLWDGPYPGVTRWYGQMQERPSFAAAYYPGTRLSEVYSRGREIDVTRSSGAPAPVTDAAASYC